MSSDTLAATQTAAFLASTCSGNLQEKVGIRWAAWIASGARADRLFVSEWARPDVKLGTYPALDIATFLIGQLRASERFICLLANDRKGSAIQPRDTALATTFFELEIFQALTLNRPTYLLVHDSFEPEALANYLDMLSFGFPDWRNCAQRRLTDSEVVRAVTRIVSGKGDEWLVRRSLHANADYLAAMFLNRDRFVNREATARTHFLQLNLAHPTHKLAQEPNREAILDLLRHRRSFEEELNNDRRLALSWILAHELMVGPLLNEFGGVVLHDPFLLRAWNAALLDWHGAASWNGLHSNIYLGTLPTLNTLDAVRRALREGGYKSSDDDTFEFPGGAYASSYYSLSKRLRGPARLRAIDLASETLRMGKDPMALASSPGDMAIAGSIAMERGNLGEAIECYERAVRLRQDSRAASRKIGESLCELAFARLRAGQQERALAESLEGIGLMKELQEDGAFIVDGFLVRAMFKHSFILYRCGRIGPAIRTYREALGHARKYALDDQLQQWKPSALLGRLARSVRDGLRRD